MANENEQHHEHHGVIPVETGIELTTNWRNYVSSSNQVFEIKSFWVAIETIKSLLHDNPEADGIRGYIGLDDPTDPTSCKIVFVSTESGVDKIYRDKHEEHSNLRDFTTMCPPICPTGSVLNG